MDTKTTAPTSPTLEVTIQGLAFSIAPRFAEMHICSAGDAAVLNAALCDHIRGAFAKEVEELLAERRLPPALIAVAGGSCRAKSPAMRNCITSLPPAPLCATR